MQMYLEKEKRCGAEILPDFAESLFLNGPAAPEPLWLGQLSDESCYDLKGVLNDLVLTMLVVLRGNRILHVSINESA
jgi:hypothetical protein